MVNNFRTAVEGEAGNGGGRRRGEAERRRRRRSVRL
jgi:hypothetical protein